MSSGFSGGWPELYSGGGGIAARSRPAPSISVNSNSSVANVAQPQQFVDPSSQITRRQPAPLPPAGLIGGKRTLSEFQTQNNYNQLLNSLLFLRTVKPRPYSQTSPISPLSPADQFSLVPTTASSDFLPSLQARPRDANLPDWGGQIRPNGRYVNNMACQGVSVSEQEAEKKMMNRLQELEKQLLDDDDDDAGDVASVITNSTSEWSEAVLDLIHQKPNSTSPASSSSSSSPSMASSPAAVCCNQSLLMEAAMAISEGRKDAAAEILTRLSSTNSTPRGNSGQKLVDHYLFKALKSRLNPTQNPPPVAELFTTEHLLSTQKLYELSRCFKLGFMAANLAILEAALEQPVSNKLHVVDFNIGQGSQYVNLLQAISVRRPGGQSVVKITAVSEDSGGEEASRAVGEVLSQHARKLGLRLRFTAVRREISELTRDSLGCEPDEALAVNFAHKLCRVPDESVSTENRRDELLRRVKGLSPKIVTLVEQELHANTAPFLTRVNEAYSYYTAVLDSVESTVPRENPDQVRAEEGLGRRLVNTVACEGRDRVERCEVFGKWRARMGMAGFEAKRPSERVVETVRGRLSSGNRVNPGFTVKEESGGVCFGWKGRTITVASAWR